MYPNEYGSNLDCSFVVKSRANTTIQVEMLEFDLEASSSDEVVSSADLAIKGLNSNRVFANKRPSACQRDYLGVNDGQVRLCGSVSAFTSILNVGGGKPSTTFRFFSDDALTRRGFWIKLKGRSSFDNRFNIYFKQLKSIF
jgi:hypothetical protein